MRLVTEPEFDAALMEKLLSLGLEALTIGSVTGPGRSGAIASVYASHILGVPFIPFGQEAPVDRGRVLVIDTAKESGRTLKKAARKYCYAKPIVLYIYNEPPRVYFWYESPKPQRYRHETIKGELHA